ncbi:MAG: helix-turn-helix transcriptional regulator [Firmicutes bacterium]|nr:helix-turn-helix transcriptional regulator [Bacillota bacterium]
MNIFAERLKELREEHELYQKELADKIGVKRGTVAAWEAGRLPERSALEKLANFFGTSVDYLLGRTDFRDAKKEEENDNTEPPHPEELEKIIKQSNLMFDGTPLDDNDKEDILDFVRIAVRAIKKRKQHGEKTTE